MGVDEGTFSDIGLTKSETKVYLALLKLGPSTKKSIVQESQISPSKLYEVTDKLREKGLVGVVVANKVQQFSAAPPEEILRYIQRKQNRLNEQTKRINKIIPNLKQLKQNDEAQVEVFHGWRGMHTVFNQMLNGLGIGDINYVFGSSVTEENAIAKRFFSHLNSARDKRGIRVKIIKNTKVRKKYKENIKDLNYVEDRYLQIENTTQINIWKDVVMIIILGEMPVITLIKHKDTAKSFLCYFECLWKTASK